MDQYKITVVLDNRLSIPVTFRVMDGIRITNVRASGEEMPSGFVSLGAWEMEPGKRTIVTDQVTTYHGYKSSRVVTLKLSGQVVVRNSMSDQLSRVKYCSYRDVEMAAPFQGSWGS